MDPNVASWAKDKINVYLSILYSLFMYLDDKEWTQMKHLEQGTRLWHSAVAVNNSTIIIAGHC